MNDELLCKSENLLNTNKHFQVSHYREFMLSICLTHLEGFTVRIRLCELFEGSSDESGSNKHFYVHHLIHELTSKALATNYSLHVIRLLIRSNVPAQALRNKQVFVSLVC